MRFHLRVYALSVLGLLLLVRGAEACSCRKVPPCKAYALASSIFVGRLIEGTSKEDMTLPNGDRVTYEKGTLRFALVEAIKGVNTPEVIVGPPWIDCEGQINFKRGGTYLVFASPFVNTPLALEICTPTNLVENVKEYLNYLRNPPAPGSGGRLSGNVVPNYSNSEGKSLPRFTIAIDDGHGNARKTRTNKDGSYAFERVAPGMYTISIRPLRDFIVNRPLTASEISDQGCVHLDFLFEPKRSRR